ncbi:hypothetical protein LCGC14_1317560 [marine sediment metagenome]|uniref:Uncharacterized protein n=1 Tax=marine sediment metagenome TaxID=412755 RepID=A0A0F9KKI1_9ZZZZ
MAPIYPFREKVVILSADAGTNYLDHVQIRQRRIFHYDHITVENETSDYTKLLLGVLSEDEMHKYEEQHSPRKGILYPWHPRKDVTVLENETLRAELQGCTSGDTLVMYVAGWYVILEKPKAPAPAPEEEAEE